MAITSFSFGQGSNSTNPTITFGFTANAGDLIVLAPAQDGAGVHSYAGDGTGSFAILGSSGAHTGFVYSFGYNICAGGETQTTDVSSTVSERWEVVGFRIPSGEWHGTTIPEVNTPVEGSSTGPDPGSITPSWGSETNNIFLAFASRDDSAANTITAYPTNYGTAQIDKNDVTSAANSGGAARTVTGSPEDPGAFTISASETWAATTIAVRPAAAAGPQTVSPGLVNMLLTPVAPAGIAQQVAPGLVNMLLTAIAPTMVSQKVAPATVDMLLTPIAPAGIHQQVQMGLVNMLLTPVEPTVVLGGGAQTVEPGLVNMLLTPVAPAGIAQQVAPGLVSMLLTPVAPAGITQQVAPGLVNMLLTPIAPVVGPPGVLPSTVSMLLTPIAPTILAGQNVGPPLVNMLLLPIAPVISQVGAITMRRMHDIQYHVVIYEPSSTGGPGNPKLELDPDALNLVWQQALNYPAQAAIGLTRFNSKLADVAFMKDHIKVFRESSKGLKTVFAGKLVKPDETTRDSILYAWDYAAFLQRSRTGFRVLYPEKTIKEVVDAEWALAKAADKSPFEFVATGTTETPLGLDGTTPIKTNSQFGVVNFDRLFLFFALAELSMANTDNTVVFEITREAPHTFNFWKNRSADKTSYAFTFPGNLIDYARDTGHAEIVNDISTPILDPTTGAQVEYSLTDTASKDEYRRLQQAVAIKTLFGINAGTTETDQQKAALARLLTLSAGIPNLVHLFPRQGELEPFDGWDLGDRFRVTLKSAKTGDTLDQYMRATGIAGAWSPSGGELLQLSVR